MSDTIRLDTWLWAARFYKTRPLAVAAIKNGRVLVNGNRAKPARGIAAGDTLNIRKEDDLMQEITVRELAGKRVSAKIAQTLYEESAASLAERAAWQERQQIARDMVRYPDAKPDKHERRQLRAIRHRDDW
ncbi:MAG: S4 domain-containing protein [Cardiobacteriaceae bacterium]|nr:S4 domain-containing protein [Cardiobacteriaceae bacterium]